MFDALRSDYSKLAFGTLKNIRKYPDITHLKGFQEYTMASYGFGIQKSSEFKGLFDHFLAQMDQSGILHQIWSRWDSVPEEKTEQEHYPIEYHTAFIPFMIISLGIGFALFIVLLEQLKMCPLQFQSKVQK